jgi:hypothetical protein
LEAKVGKQKEAESEQDIEHYELPRPIRCVKELIG